MLEAGNEVTCGTASPSPGGYLPPVSFGFGGLYAVQTLFGTTAGASGYPRSLRVQVTQLVHLTLREPVDVSVEPDGDGFLARSRGLPLFGYGDTVEDAINMLRHEIEALHAELNADTACSAHWDDVRKRLNRLVE